MATLAGVAVTAAALTLGPWHGTRGPGAASPDATSAPSPRRDLTWTARQGVPFPVSATAGPLHRDGALATSFSHDDTGAALAAIWIVYQASSAPGPSIYRPALTRQVTGAHAATLAVSVAADYAASAAQSGITNGAALPGGDARFAAYRVSPLPAGNRQVQVYERAPDAAGMPAVYTFTVATTWVDGDWKVVAPASGAWNTAFVQVDDVPTAAVALAGAR